MINHSCVRIKAHQRKNIWHPQKTFDTRRQLVARADESTRGTKKNGWHTDDTRLAQTRYSFFYAQASFCKNKKIKFVMTLATSAKVCRKGKSRQIIRIPGPFVIGKRVLEWGNSQSTIYRYRR